MLRLERVDSAVPDLGAREPPGLRPASWPSDDAIRCGGNSPAIAPGTSGSVPVPDPHREPESGWGSDMPSRVKTRDAARPLNPMQPHHRVHRARRHTRATRHVSHRHLPSPERGRALAGHPGSRRPGPNRDCRDATPLSPINNLGQPPTPLPPPLPPAAAFQPGWRMPMPGSVTAVQPIDLSPPDSLIRCHPGPGVSQPVGPAELIPNAPIVDCHEGHSYDKGAHHRSRERAQSPSPEGRFGAIACSMRFNPQATEETRARWERRRSSGPVRRPCAT